MPGMRRYGWVYSGVRFALRHEIGKFDLVHLHCVFLWPTWAAAVAARNVDIPYVLSPRGMLVKELRKRLGSELS